MKKKKETYRQRWLKEHPEIHIHLPKDVFKKLLELENTLGKNKNDIIKDLINGVVFNFDEYRKKIEKEVGDKKFDEGYNSALKKFVESPDHFYNYIRRKYHMKKLRIKKAELRHDSDDWIYIQLDEKASKALEIWKRLAPLHKEFGLYIAVGWTRNDLPKNKLADELVEIMRLSGTGPYWKEPTSAVEIVRETREE